MSRKQYLTTAEAAALLGVSAKTLAQWRWRKTGPVGSRPTGGKVVYARADLDAFVSAGRRPAATEGR